MKFHVTQDLELKVAIREALKENDFYCPCVVNSKGNEEYKCPCKNFREETPAGEICHCGLYIKDEE
jgi:ferredoxin-thioredoxin reductase catalytic subunit